MPRNVEIKAKVANSARFRRLARELADGEGEDIRQIDTFFTVPRGRLKLRDFGDGRGELIRYQRPDTDGPKVSDYAISRTDDPAGLGQVLAGALPVLGVVRKQRTLLMAGRTRIHLDEVENLGTFMELEVVLADEETAAEGEAEARRLMAALEIGPADLVEGAYLDHLLNGD